MRFIHIADVHLGAKPSVSEKVGEKRTQEIKNKFLEVLDKCEREAIDLLLIAGDLFHRQPLKVQLEEVARRFAALSHTKVVFVVGNHDYLSQNSWYRKIKWSENVYPLFQNQVEAKYLPEYDLTVYGLSYDRKEITEPLYDQVRPEPQGKYHILLAHGGDEKHIPLSATNLLKHGFDYIAMGHIHKPAMYPGGRAAYAGALEPIDKNDIGPHGYVEGRLDETGLYTRFVPCAKREYVHLHIPVMETMYGYEVMEEITSQIKERGREHFYKICLTGYRNPDIQFQLESLLSEENIIEIVDETRPSYNYEKLKSGNKNNLIGRYIESFEQENVGKLEQIALEEGIAALLETKKE